jgi:hypothetical protein
MKFNLESFLTQFSAIGPKHNRLNRELLPALIERAEQYEGEIEVKPFGISRRNRSYERGSVRVVAARRVVKELLPVELQHDRAVLTPRDDYGDGMGLQTTAGRVTHETRRIIQVSYIASVLPDGSIREVDYGDF